GPPGAAGDGARAPGHRQPLRSVPPSLAPRGRTSPRRDEAGRGTTFEGERSMNALPQPFGGSLNVRPVPEVPAPHAEHDDGIPGAPDSPGKKISAGLVWRAFRRHWWQVLLLWGIGSSALAAAAFHMIKPTYDALARVRVEPGEQSLYTSKHGTP